LQMSVISCVTCVNRVTSFNKVTNGKNKVRVGIAPHICPFLFRKNTVFLYPSSIIYSLSTVQYYN
jgi:hypothetical protein